MNVSEILMSSDVGITTSLRRIPWRVECALSSSMSSRRLEMALPIAFCQPLTESVFLVITECDDNTKMSNQTRHPLSVSRKDIPKMVRLSYIREPKPRCTAPSRNPKPWLIPCWEINQIQEKTHEN